MDGFIIGFSVSVSWVLLYFAVMAVKKAFSAGISFSE